MQIKITRKIKKESRIKEKFNNPRPFSTSQSDCKNLNLLSNDKFHQHFPLTIRTINQSFPEQKSYFKA